MTSSRHWGVVDVVDLRRGAGPVGVGIAWGISEAEGAMDWKAWMGRASKNSWANMNGDLFASRDLISWEEDVQG